MKIFKEFAARHFPEMTQHLVREFKVPNFRPKMIYDDKKERSEGGVKIGKHVTPYLFINTGYLTRHYKSGEWKFVYKEYPHIDNRVDIGTYTGSWQQFMIGTLSHEMAHAFSLWMASNDRQIVIPDQFRVSQPPLGDFHYGEWQYIYSLLRKKYLNPLQSKQRDLEELFEIR